MLSCFIPVKYVLVATNMLARWSFMTFCLIVIDRHIYHFCSFLRSWTLGKCYRNTFSLIIWVMRWEFVFLSVMVNNWIGESCVFVYMLIVFWWHRKPQFWWFRFWHSDYIPGDFQILSVLSLARLCYILVSKMMNDIPTWFKSHFIWSLSLMLSGTWVDCAGSLQAIRGGRSRTRFLLVNYCCVCIWKFLGGCGKYSLFFNNLNRLFTWKFLKKHFFIF